MCSPPIPGKGSSVKLEELCKMDMRYGGGEAWIKPFGEKEAAGFGSGAGGVTGERLSGQMTWSNHPRRREDGVWCPNLNGFIVTPDGAHVLVAIQGYSVLEDSPEVRRAIAAAVTFQAADPKYRWLNFVLGVGEGEIAETDPGSAEVDHWWLRVYACVNEIAKYPPKIK
jgi:hypothetical protein